MQRGWIFEVSIRVENGNTNVRAFSVLIPDQVEAGTRLRGFLDHHEIVSLTPRRQLTHGDIFEWMPPLEQIMEVEIRS
jgi:hypothetical protein